MSFDLGLSAAFVFTGLEWGYGFRERRPQRWSVILITSYQMHMLSTWLSIVYVNLDRLAEVVLVGFLHHKITFPPIFHSLWKRVTMHGSDLRSGGLEGPRTWGWNIFISISISISISIYLSISILFLLHWTFIFPSSLLTLLSFLPYSTINVYFFIL